MKRVRYPDELIGDPVDRYWVGANQLVWCRSPEVCGTLHWGRPDERDAVELARVLELALHPALTPGFDVFMDARAIEHVDWAGYQRLLASTRDRAADWNQRIRRQAVVAPPGPAAALLAGMAPLVGLAYPMRFVTTPDDALDWLGWVAKPDARASVDEAARLAAQARGVRPVVQRLRGWLERALHGASLEAAAAGLVMSARSLQRALREAGTSFTAELQAARVRAACALLDGSDDKIEVIARAVGATSASQLGTMFRRQLGLTPGRYRALAATTSPEREPIAARAAWRAASENGPMG